MPSRVDPFAIAHKGLRHALGRAIDLAGGADPGRPDQASVVVNHVTELLVFLRSHGRVEDEILFPDIEARQPGATHPARGEHVVLDAELDALERGVHRLTEVDDDRAAALAALYVALGRFTGAYLLHIYEEERRLLPVVQAAYTDAEVHALVARVMASLTPAETRVAISHALPALSLPERCGWLAGVRSNASAPVWDGVVQLARTALPADEFASTMARLA